MSQSSTSSRGALAGLALSMLLSSLGTSIVNVALPTLAHDFSAPFAKVQWIVLAYLVAITALIVVAGRLGDMFGRRRLLLVGVSLFTIASLACGAATSLWLLVAARALQGLGAAIMMSLSIAFVGETVAKDRIGSAMGMLGTMSAIGTAIGPSIGGALISALGWRAIFFLKVPIGVAAILFARRYLPVDRQTVRAPVGMSQALNLLRSTALRAGLFMSLLVSTVMMATLVVGPFYLSRALGLDAAHIGLVMSAGPLVAALVSVPAGRAVDRFGTQPTTIAGLLAIVAGSLLLSSLPPRLELLGYVLPTMLSTAGYALFQAANNTAIMTNIQSDTRGLVAGLLSLSRNLGFIIGASAMGAVFTLASATRDITQASASAAADGMRGTFAVATILVVTALVVAYWREPVRRIELASLSSGS